MILEASDGGAIFSTQMTVWTISNVPRGREPITKARKKSKRLVADMRMSFSEGSGIASILFDPLITMITVIMTMLARRLIIECIASELAGVEMVTMSTTTEGTGRDTDKTPF
jgi:hypothetical protein